MSRSIPRSLSRALPILSIVCTMLCVTAPSLRAQSQSQASAAVVEGRVVGPDTAPVAGAEVRLRSGGKNVGASVMTSADGWFRIEGVPAPGSYELTCKLGHRTEKGADVTVQSPGAVVVPDVMMLLSMSEELSVSADSWTLPTDAPCPQSRSSSSTTARSCARW